MIRLIVILPLVACICAGPPPKGHDLPAKGIIGGDYAKEGQFPYQLSLQRKRVHYCGASLVSGKAAITAAHCTRNEDLNYLSVVAGTVDRQSERERIFVDYVEQHHKFEPSVQDYDISLLFLKRSFQLGGKIKPIGVAKTKEVIPAGAYATVSGWGASKATGDNTGANTKFLKFVNIPIWKKSRCDQKLQRSSSRVYCGGDDSGLKNACAGDSGSPLVYKNKLFGVVSFGYGCGNPNQPVVYTNVAKHRPWITRKVLGLPLMDFD